MRASELVDHIPQLYTVAMRYVRDSAQAEDLVHETLTKAIEHWDQYDPNQNLRAWLLGILTHRFIDIWRTQNIRVMLPLSAVEPSADLREQICESMLCDEVLHALEQIAPEQRAAIERVDINGASYEQAAAELGIPAGTLMSRLYRARKALRETLAELAKDEWGIG